MVASYRKVIVVEPRYSDEFEAAMRQFYEVIESTGGGGKDGDGSVNGALFIAVCRGKVRSGRYPYIFFSLHSVKVIDMPERRSWE